MKQKVIEAFNRQIQLEFEAAMLYLHLSVGLQELGLHGCAHWLRQQFHEECSHALHLITYLGERRVAAQVPALAAPVAPADSALGVFEQVLAHEQSVSAAVDALVAAARTAADYASENLMMQYVREQVEEEHDAADIVDCLRLAERNRAGLLRIDRHLGKRKAYKYSKAWS
ncbi:MAG: hypothetical protein MJ051_01820 [Akkermansia sp.]|nr:hypothetical protein [Akkermansia sp.]